jgi:hypothetical protein
MTILQTLLSASNAVATSGGLSIDSSGRILNNGTPFMLRGTNMSGLNDQAMEGYGVVNPWGNNYTAGDPNWVWFQNFKYNTARFPINAQSFMAINYQLLTGSNLASGAWGGTNYNADPFSNYKAYLARAINNGLAHGCQAFIFDCHESAPQFDVNGTTQYLGAADQGPFIDQTGYNYWTTSAGLPQWLATNWGSPTFNATYGYNGGAAGQYWNPLYGGSTGFGWAIFELYNEPYFNNQAFTLTTNSGTYGNPAWLANNGGSPYVTTNGGTPPDTPGHTRLANYTRGEEFVMLYGGFCNWFYQQGATFNGRGIPSGFTSPGGLANALNLPWTVFGTQGIVNTLRSQGFPNIIQLNGCGYASGQSTIPYYMAVDTLSPPQISTGLHAYQSGSSTYPSTQDPGSGTASCLQYAAANAAGTSALGYAVPVVIDEIGTYSGSSLTQSDPYYTRMLGIVDGATLGTRHFVDFCMNGPPASSSTEQWCEGYLGSAISVTASCSGNVLTVTSGSGIVAGMSIQTGALYNGTYIDFFGTGSTSGTGGTGTYWIDNPQTFGSTTITLKQFTVENGQSYSMTHWATNHA